MDYNRLIKIADSVSDSKPREVLMHWFDDNAKLVDAFLPYMDAVSELYADYEPKHLDDCNDFVTELQDLADENDSAYSAIYNAIDYIRNKCGFRCVNEVARDYCKAKYSL